MRALFVGFILLSGCGSVEDATVMESGSQPFTCAASPGQMAEAAKLWNFLGWNGWLKRNCPDFYGVSPRDRVFHHPWPEGFQQKSDPVYAHNEAFVAGLTPANVRSIMLDPSNYPRFYPNSGVAMADGVVVRNLQVGLQYDWKTFSVKQRVTVVEIGEVAGALTLGWLAKSPGTSAYHRWIFAPENGGTRIITEEVQNGPTAWLDAFLMNSALRASHQMWVDGLGAYASRPSTRSAH